jgi:surface antigen
MGNNLKICVLASSLFLCACQTDSWGGGETLGTLGGAAAGGLVGSAVSGGSSAGILTGVLLGGFTGNQLGGTVDDQDRRRAQYYR